MPASPPPQSSPFAAILQAVVARLAAAIGVSTAYIRPVASDRYPVSETEPRFLYVQVFGPGQPHDPALNYPDAGAGNLFRPTARRVRVYTYTRSSTDVEGGDETALYGSDAAGAAPTADAVAVQGQFLLEEQVIQALSDWTPLSGSGVPLTIGPIHAISSEGGPPEREPEDDAGLVRSMMDFEAVYALAIRSTEPNP